jgi:hypothetical protein
MSLNWLLNMGVFWLKLPIADQIIIDGGSGSCDMRDGILCSVSIQAVYDHRAWRPIDRGGNKTALIAGGGMPCCYQLNICYQ